MARPPNILWIITTQWRAQATGYAGDPNARTPCLDAMARASVNYAQAVTPHPFGPFARAAMFTGIPSPENGVRDYFDPLPTHARTIAHRMNDRGYDTAFFGKWHLWNRDPTAPLVGEAHARIVVPPEARGGFALWEGFESGFLLNNPWLHGTRLPEPARFRGYQSDILSDRFISWHRSRGHPHPASASLPWFAVVSLEAPHPPYDARSPVAIASTQSAMVSPQSLTPEQIVLAPNVPRQGEVEATARRELAGYYTHIEATDHAIGQMITALPPDTIIVVTSVHGDMHGAHGLFRKGWPHEESVRVPFLVRGAPSGGSRDGHPGFLSGSICLNDEPVSLVDLPEMTLSWSEGRPWTCSRARADISMPSVVPFPNQCDRAWLGQRTPTHKVIFLETGERWLEFDLASDPLEMKNRVKTNNGFSK